jgi:hypothetical protein
MDKPKLAQHVRLGDCELVVDGEDFPWMVAPNVKVTATGHAKIPYRVHVEIYPVELDRDETLAITCPPRSHHSPIIGDVAFPWLIAKEGYRVIGTKPCPRLRLAFFAVEFEDARTNG